LGLQNHNKSFIIGNKKSVVDSCPKIQSKIHRIHTALSFHRVKKPVLAKIIGSFHIEGESNLAEILSKHRSFSSSPDFLGMVIQVIFMGRT